jgi:mRNA-degrading endonuclease RelE of RelBE toxin-antitoxin system
MNVSLLADGTDDTTAYAGAQAEPAYSDSVPPQEEATDGQGSTAGRRRMSLDDIKRRDDLVRVTVTHLRMTAPQIHKFSEMWEFPFYSESDVWRRIKALKLDGRVKHVASQSLHDEWTIRILIKIVRDASRNGIVVEGIRKEYRLGDSSGIRADLYLRLRQGARTFQFFIETQQSALTFRSWKSKLTKYLNYYRRRRIGPFRILVVFENEDQLRTVLKHAAAVMEGRDNTLFLFAYMPDLLGQYDTVMEDIWTTHRREPVALCAKITPPL